MMNNLTLIFNDVEQVHLGKDVFLVPYYISKKYNLKLDIVFPNTITNRELPAEYRGAHLIREKFLYKSRKFVLIKEFNFFKYIIKNNKHIDYLMLFHITKKTMLQTIIYKLLNPKGKVYVKLDLSLDALRKKQSYKTYRFRWQFTKFLMRIFSKKVDLISSESVSVYNKILSNGLYDIKVNEKLTYIPNGVDDELLDNLSLQVLPFEQKQNIIITVGRIGTYQKNNEMLLKSLDGIFLDDWKVYFIGPIDEQFKIVYDAFIQKNPDKKESVLLIGNISDKKELFTYYNQAKVFVLTSIKEGSALVFPEALYFGDYIISTDVGGASDITENSSIGKIIPVNDATALKKEIVKVINNEINLNEKYIESIKLSRDKFLWSKIVDDPGLSNLFN